MDIFLRDASFIFLACLCIFCHLHPDHLEHTREKGTRLHFANSDGPGPVTHPCSRAVGYVSVVAVHCAYVTLSKDCFDEKRSYSIVSNDTRSGLAVRSSQTRYRVPCTDPFMRRYSNALVIKCTDKSVLGTRSLITFPQASIIAFDNILTLTIFLDF